MSTRTARWPRGAESRLLVVAVLAALLPALLAYNVSPSPTYLNQALAIAAWGLFASSSRSVQRGTKRGPILEIALLGVATGALISWLANGLPSSLALSSLCMLAVAAFVTVGGRVAGQPAFYAFALAWLAAGAANTVIALLQVFAPTLTDGTFIATSGLPGRAVGNLRQPNHMSSLLLWGCIAAVALHELKRLRTAAAAALAAAMILAVVLTASRTGLVSVILFALWGLLDRRLSKPARAMLLAAPLVYGLSWWLLAYWAEASQHAFGGSQRLAEGDISSSRFDIWRDTLTLIRMHPWTGVGLGEFNFAWTLTPFPQRPTAFFDHTHNLPLQLLVELGLPLGGLVLSLLLWALWRGLRQAWTEPAHERSVAQRCAMLMVLMIGLHSLLEYPLWYSYFLLPAAWAWGFAMQPSDDDARSAASAVAASKVRRFNFQTVAAALVVVGAAFSVWDYFRVAAIFAANEDAPPLAQRIAAGQRSVFFAHHADYAAVTAGLPVADPERAFDRATHYLLDTRLMTAWAVSLAERGQLDKAQHIAQRLREFRKAESEEFFAPCDPLEATAPAGAAADRAESTSAPAGAATAPPAAAASGVPAAVPFQCQRPQRDLDWREFLPAGRESGLRH